jgi:hypothetical protein
MTYPKSVDFIKPMGSSKFCNFWRLINISSGNLKEFQNFQTSASGHDVSNSIRPKIFN